MYCMYICIHFISQSSIPLEELINVPVRPSIDVSIPQGVLPSAGSGSPTPSDLRMTRIFGRVQGTPSASVSTGDLFSIVSYIIGSNVLLLFTGTRYTRMWWHWKWEHSVLCRCGLEQICCVLHVRMGL